MNFLDLKALADALPPLAITDAKHVVDSATEQIIETKLLYFDGNMPYVLQDGRFVQLAPKEAKTCIRQLLPRNIRSKVSPPRSARSTSVFWTALISRLTWTRTFCGVSMWSIPSMGCMM